MTCLFLTRHGVPQTARLGVVGGWPARAHALGRGLAIPGRTLPERGRDDGKLGAALDRLAHRRRVRPIAPARAIEAACAPSAQCVAIHAMGAGASGAATARARKEALSVQVRWEAGAPGLTRLGETWSKGWVR